MKIYISIGAVEGWEEGDTPYPAYEHFTAEDDNAAIEILKERTKVRPENWYGEMLYQITELGVLRYAADGEH